MEVDNMKKGNIYKALFLISGVLILVFCVGTIVDYINYSTTLNSAPFYVFVLANTVMYILPSFILAILAFVLKKKLR